MTRPSTNRPIRGVALCAVLSCCTVASAKVTYEEHIKPIFREHCAGCHNQDDAASGLALDNFDAILAGGAGGEALAAGDPDDSRLWRLVNHDEEPVMPPGGDKLPAGQLAAMKEWIETGLLKDAGSKPMASRKPAIAAVEAGELGKPQGEPAMPTGWFRQTVLTSSVVGPIDSLAASPWAPVVAVPWQRQVSVYHTKNHRLLGVIPYLEGSPRVVRFSRDGSLLLVAGGLDGASGSASLFDVKTGARLVTVGDELDAVLAADVSADNRLVAIGGPKKKVRVFRVADGSLAYTCEKHTDWITALAFGPAGKLLATGDRASGLRLWDASAGHERADLRGHKQAITAIDWRRDGGLLASASEDGSVRLWNAAGASVKSINAHKGGTASVAFAADGRLVSTGRDRLAKVWKPDGAHLADMKRLDDIGLAAAFTHAGDQVVVGDWTGGVQCIDVATKQRAARLTPNPPRLQDRLVRTSQKLSEAVKRLTQTKGDHQQATEALADGRARHKTHREAVTAGKQAKEAAEQSMQAADAEATASTAAFEAAMQLLADAEQRLTEAKKALAESGMTDATDDAVDSLAEEAERLADAVDAARADRNNARAELATQEKRRTDAQAALAVAKKDKAISEQTAARLEEQAKQLPKLPELEAAVANSEAAVEKASCRRASMQKRHDRLEHEIASYDTAIATLSNEAAAATAERDKLSGDAERLKADRDDRSNQLAELQAEADRLATEAEALERRLKEARDQRGGSQAELDRLDETLESRLSSIAAAERRASLAEARLAALREAEAWRAARDAKEQR